MPVAISQLSDRQWVQVRAALQFWRDIVEISREHPSAHPKVAPYFHEHGPLNLDEIDELLESTPDVAWLTPQKVANRYGCNKTTVDKAIRDEGVEPDLVAGKLKAYRAESFMPVIANLERRGYGEK